MPQSELAHADMEAQLEEGDGYVYSLSSMWRACGCPEGRDPKTWLEIAAPLIAGFAAYFKRLDDWREERSATRATGRVEDEVFTHEVELESESLWRPGDSCASWAVANHYARFLDYGDASL